MKNVFREDVTYKKGKNKKVLSKADIVKRIAKGLTKADINKMNMK